MERQPQPPAQSGKRRGQHSPDPRAGRQRKKHSKPKGQSGKANSAESASRRDRVDQTRRKQAERGEGRPIWADEFTEEEIKNEQRRPKYKVALIFGYAGTGYHGSQIGRTEPTIEGDLFRACVRGGAVSKANSDDPKKISWVRCSRTDRNVHAAANVISAQLIIQEEDVVQRINEHLPPQIRAWGYEKLSKSFNAYQRCEGRIYQYWIPTYCFIPPHPRSFLGSQLIEIAKESGRDDGYQERQKEVADFWSEAEEEFITPVLKQYDDETGSSALNLIMEGKLQTFKAKTGAMANGQPPEKSAQNGTPEQTAPESQLEIAVKALKDAFRSARRSYRIDDARLKRIRNCMTEFNGTHNYWNYTVRKKSGDPSSKRFMMACTANNAPIVVDGTEWLPLNFHGQSFMMNQIRKMVSIVALVVRCGSPLSVIRDSFSSTKLTIPKAPPTGLLLEHPVFDAYNKSLDRLPEDERRGRLDFEKFRDEIEAFKREHIVTPIHGIESNESVYSNFFLALDSLRSAQLLYFSTLGVPATERAVEGEESLENVIAEDEEEADQGGDE